MPEHFEGSSLVLSLVLVKTQRPPPPTQDVPLPHSCGDGPPGDYGPVA